MTPKTFTAERIFKATRKEVWRALTEKELMKQWYFDLPEFRAEVGFTFGITGLNREEFNTCITSK